MWHSGCIHKLTTAGSLTEDLDKVNSANSGINGESVPQTLWLNEELLAIESWWRELTILWGGVSPLVGFHVLVNGPLLTQSHMNSSNLMGYQKRRHDAGKGNLVRFGRRKWVVVIMFHYTCIHSLSRIKKSVTKNWAHNITSFTMAQPHTAGAHWSPLHSSTHPLYLPAPSFPTPGTEHTFSYSFSPIANVLSRQLCLLLLLPRSTTPYVHTSLGFLLTRGTTLFFVSLGYFG